MGIFSLLLFGDEWEETHPLYLDEAMVEGEVVSPGTAHIGRHKLYDNFSTGPCRNCKWARREVLHCTIGGDAVVQCRASWRCTGCKKNE